MPESRMRCHQVVQYLSALADGELAEPLRSRVALHVAECADCTARLADFRQIDTLLAGMPATRPSPRVFENIQLAIQAEADPQAVREPLSHARRTDVLRRRLAAVRAPARAPAPLPAQRSGPRARVLAGALPALAAVLLIGLALFGFERVRQPTVPRNVLEATPVASLAALQQANEQVVSVRKQLSFVPALPSYLPAGAQIGAVTTTPMHASGAVAGTYLDVTWTYTTGTVCRVHLREAPTALGWQGYAQAGTDAALSWQLPNSQPWRPLNVLSGSSQPAVGQMRTSFSIALDVRPCPGPDDTQSAIAILRLISLSIDAPYRPPVELIPIPGNGAGLVLHWIAVVSGTGGQVRFRQEVYTTADSSEQELSITEGNALVSQTAIHGQQALQLDPAHAQYFVGTASAVGGPVAAPNFTALRLFYEANTLEEQGYLWNLGPSTYGGARVLAFALVDGRSPALAYVDPTTDEVMAVTVSVGSVTQPGGPDAQPWFVAPCGSYVLIEYLAHAPANSFSMTPPKTYTQTTTPLTPPTCPSGG